jgi:hypothetical protein
MVTQKSQQGGVLKFSGKQTYPEKCLSLQHSQIKFFIAERYQEFLMSVEIRMCVYYLITAYFV